MVMNFGELEIGAVFWFRDRRYRKVANSAAEMADPAYPQEEGWACVFLAETEIVPEEAEKRRCP